MGNELNRGFKISPQETLDNREISENKPLSIDESNALWNHFDDEFVFNDLTAYDEKELLGGTYLPNDTFQVGDKIYYTDENGQIFDYRSLESGFLSTHKERVDRTPSENSDRGEWTGDRGESTYIPSDEKMKELLAQYGMEGIEYKDGIPDFSQCSECTVEIDNMTENRYSNFAQCDEKCAEQWNKEGRDGKTDWTARDVQKWRSENGYSWHERNDMKTCDLVPTEVNDYFGHLGGVAECKKRDAEQNIGGDFDE